MKRYLISSLLIILINSNSFCQVINCNWVEHISFSPNFYSRAIGKIIPDSQGNIYYLFNVSYDTIYLNNSQFNVRRAGLIVSKLNATGNVVWAKLVSFCIGGGFVLDNFGNLYIAGASISRSNQGELTIVDNDTISSDESFFVLKLDTSGIVKWWRTAGPGAGACGYPGYSCNISVDVQGNIYWSRRYCGSPISFGNNVLNVSNTSGCFIAKYDSSGNNIWAEADTTLGTGPGFIDGQGNYYLCGSNFAKYDTSGTLAWYRNDIYLPGARNFVVDNLQNIYITGYYTYYPPYQNPNPIVIGNDTLDNYSGGVYMIKLDPSGNIIWVKSSGDTTGIDNAVWPPYIAIDQNDDLYILGDHYLRMSFGHDTLPNDFVQIFLTKFDSSGTEIWAKSIGGDSSEYAGAIAIDNSGNLYISGTFNSDTLNLGNTSLINTHPGLNPRNYDMFLTKINVLTANINNDQNTTNVLIYPNPTTTSFKIKLPPQIKSIRIYNSLGQLIENRMTKTQAEQSFTIKENGV